MSVPGSGAGLVSQLGDEELIIRCRAGDEAAWALLVDRYERLVVSIPRKSQLGDDAVADVFDGVFAELWRALPQLARPAQVRAWLVTVARRRTLAQLQYQRRWVNLAELDDGAAVELTDPAPVGDPVLLEAEREQSMRVALARLPLRCQRLLQWLFFSDPAPNYEEIGRRLGLSANSIGFVRGRCLRKLRQTLESETR